MSQSAVGTRTTSLAQAFLIESERESKERVEVHTGASAPGEGRQWSSRRAEQVFAKENPVSIWTDELTVIHADGSNKESGRVVSRS